MWDEKKAVPLRAHHGMCLAYFEGKGYSEGFTAHMQEMLERLSGEMVLVCLVTHTDEICSACPKNENGICQSEARVWGFDNSVLRLCGLKEGQTMEFREFTSLVQRRILSAGKREEICGDCGWANICANRESRWNS